MLKFTPRISDTAAQFLNDKKLPFELIRAFNSPLNIIYPQETQSNITKFKAVYAKHKLFGEIFWAHKSNKAGSFATEFAAAGIGIDVASKNELIDALAAGFRGERIEATGPKNSDFIYLGLQHRILFNVDNLDELQLIASLVRNNNAPARILLRLSDFSEANRKSRFGISPQQFDKALAIIKENVAVFDFLGLAFHLDTIEIREKTTAISETLKLFFKSCDAGFTPKILNIGGGFRVNYLASKQEWNDSISELKDSIVGKIPQLTWGRHSYGAHLENKTLRGGPNIYDFYNETVGADYLDALLAMPLDDFEGRAIGEFLSENMITLYIEPGSSLLAGAGLTMARVEFLKESSENELLVGLDIKKSDIFMGQELFVDPIILSPNPNTNHSEFYMLGNLCLENDVLCMRKIFSTSTPQRGDIFVFANTAGYFMDFNATNSIMHNPAQKLAVYQNAVGDLEWTLDKNYYITK
jgi:diaminopimelate decarboxylase